MLDFKKSSTFSKRFVFSKSLVYHHLNVSFLVNFVLIEEKFIEKSEPESRPFAFSSDFANETIVPSVTSVSLTHLFYSFACERAASVSSCLQKAAFEQ